ncbi:MAG: hypothetical protein AAGA42_19865 [Actinomycetota bacterium]
MVTAAIVAALVVATPATLQAHGDHQHDHEQHDDEHDHGDDHGLGIVTIKSGTPGDPVAAEPAPFPYDETFQLHSRPGSDRVIHLDFDGFTSPADIPPTVIFGIPLANVTYLPYDLDGDGTSWSDAELDVVQAVWLRVSEAFASWDVNVTTEEPSDDALARSSFDESVDSTWGVRTLITNSTSGGLTDFCQLCIGLAQGIVFGNGLGLAEISPASITMPQRFGPGRAADVQMISATVTHELAHNIVLDHDWLTPTTDIAAPLMLANYEPRPLMPFTPISGELTNPTGGLAVEDFSQLGVDVVPDDHGDDATSATPLSAPVIDAAGLVAFGGDEDWFNFEVSDGDTIDLAITRSPYSFMLDLDAAVIDGDGQEVATSNPPAVALSTSEATGLDASFEGLSLPAGEYSLRVRGSGGDGYTEYGSIGTYTISGAITSPDVPCSPGSSSTTGNEPCDPAPPGRFVDAQGATTATPCSAGTFSSTSGATACTNAPAGTFVDAEGAAAATPCPPGFYQPATGSTACLPADVGFFVGVTGSVAQQPCPDGTETTVVAQTECTPIVDPQPPTVPAQLKSVRGCSEDGSVCVTLTGTLLNARNGSSHKAWFHRDGDPVLVTVDESNASEDRSLRCSANGDNGTLEVFGDELQRASKVGGGLYSIAGKSVRFICEGFGTSFDVRRNSTHVPDAALIPTAGATLAGSGVNDAGELVEVSVPGTVVEAGVGDEHQAFSIAEGTDVTFTVGGVDTTSGAIFCDADQGTDNGLLKVRGKVDRAGRAGGGLFTQTGSTGLLHCTARNGPAVGAAFLIS